jgi:hypothetical protein
MQLGDRAHKGGMLTSLMAAGPAVEGRDVGPISPYWEMGETFLISYKLD